jgi:hypothetical protein
MARPPDDSFAVPARHKQTSPLSAKFTPCYILMFWLVAGFADGGLSRLTGEKFELSLPTQGQTG